MAWHTVQKTSFKVRIQPGVEADGAVVCAEVDFNTALQPSGPGGSLWWLVAAKPAVAAASVQHYLCTLLGLSRHVSSELHHQHAGRRSYSAMDLSGMRSAWAVRTPALALSGIGARSMRVLIVLWV